MPGIRLKNTENRWPLLRVFIDSDVLFAGSASPNTHSASNVILQMAEITLIEAIISEQVVTEVSRNLTSKMPSALPTFNRLIQRSVRIVPDPSRQVVESLRTAADWKDVPILGAAVETQCHYLLTFNIRHYQPGVLGIGVLRPREFIHEVRMRLSELSSR